ncbi:MAG: tRNA (adenosine(37)-N6)-threonylcarbamoyltransferase complex ATPase subunit type 1 TsaE [Opitutales bacterium]|nr:tRNA (adenosine(37)-N6)-threonylcarbamoyltransferase complex ATPase subunit type 1 TsaE [Opitutales bacterium]
MATNILDRLRAGVVTDSPEATEDAGRQLAAAMEVDQVLALRGDLGAGKTTFVRGLARGLGIAETPTSPTYNIYASYSGNRQLLHMDAYRLNSGDDVEDLMLEDFLRSPWLIVVEWPEKIQSWLEDESVTTLDFSILADGRHRIQMV